MRRGIRFPQWWMLLVAILSILSGQGSLVGMERFAKRHRKTLNELVGTDFGKSPSDSTFRLLLAVGVNNQPLDVEHLEPMLQRIATSAGGLPEVMTLDAGYWSEANAGHCETVGIDAYIATGRLAHGQPPPLQRGPLPRDADAKTRMARKLRSKKGSRIYAQRKAIVEPVNGQIKGARGLDRFRLRGLEKVDGEWTLMAITHNIGKLHRAALAVS